MTRIPKIPTGHGYGYDSDTDHTQIKIDDELGRGIAEGNEQAMEAFHRRWWRYTLNYVKGRVWNFQDAEEIASDVFQSLWTATRAGRWRYGMFVRFFYGVLRRQVQFSNHQRAAIREQRRCEIYADMMNIGETPASSNPERTTMSKAFEDAFLEALLGLKPKPRMAFRLVHLDGYRRVDAAHIMGTRQAHMYQLLQKACQHLQKSLAGWSLTPPVPTPTATEGTKKRGRRGVSDDEIADIRKRHARGENTGLIASRVGVHPATVRKYLK